MRFKLAFFLVAASLPGWTLTPTQSDVVIIGAGLSGLTAAYELKKAGIPYHILEMAPIIGGRVRTVRYQRDGELLYADSGMEEYWQSNPAVQYIKELKLPASEGVAATSLIIDGTLYALGGNESTTQFQKRIFTDQEYASWQAFEKKIAPWIKDLKAGKLRPELLKLKEHSFASFVESQKLPRKVSEWIRISLECEIGASWDSISAIDGIADFHIFINGGEMYTRIEGGNDRFVKALAEAVGWDHISVNRRVTRVVTKEDKVSVFYLDTQTHENQMIRASHVISTIPLFRLFQVQFEPSLSEKKQKAIDTMTWGSYFKTHVFVPSQAAAFWTKDGASVLPILSDSELGVIYEGNPEQTTATKILSLLVHGPHAETFNMMSSDQVRQEIKEAFEKLWPGFTQYITGLELYPYHPRAIAAWPVGRSRYDEFSDEIRHPENRVYLAGDFTESSHSDGAFISAKRVVRQVLEKIKEGRKN